MASKASSTAQIVFVRPLLGDEIATPKARSPGSRFENATNEAVTAAGVDATNELFARAYQGGINAADLLVYVALQAAAHVERLAEEKRDVLANVAPKWPVWPLRATPLKASLNKALEKMVSFRVGAESGVYLSPQINFENPLTKIAGILSATLSVNARLMKEQRKKPLPLSTLTNYDRRFPGSLCRTTRAKLPPWLRRLSKMRANASARELWDIAWAAFIETYPDFQEISGLARGQPQKRRTAIRKGLRQAFLSLSKARKAGKSRG